MNSFHDFKFSNTYHGQEKNAHPIIRLARVGMEQEGSLDTLFSKRQITKFLGQCYRKNFRNRNVALH